MEKIIKDKFILYSLILFGIFSWMDSISAYEIYKRSSYIRPLFNLYTATTIKNIWYYLALPQFISAIIGTKILNELVERKMLPIYFSHLKRKGVFNYIIKAIFMTITIYTIIMTIILFVNYNSIPRIDENFWISILHILNFYIAMLFLGYFSLLMYIITNNSMLSILISVFFQLSYLLLYKGFKRYHLFYYIFTVKSLSNIEEMVIYKLIIPVSILIVIIAISGIVFRKFEPKGR